MWFGIRTEGVAATFEAIRAEVRNERERKDVDRIWAEDDIVIITVVGAGMRGMPGVAARVCGALADHGINIEVIAQGSSEYSISLVVSSDDAVKAVQVLHNLVAEVVRQWPPRST